jgi:predicted DsbA family dithiol-disulfide isomerase
MPDDPKRKAARKAVKAAQLQFDRESAATQKARRKAFADGQKAGLSLRDIGDEVGLHRSRVAQIIKGK